MSYDIDFSFLVDGGPIDEYDITSDAIIETDVLQEEEEEEEEEKEEEENDEEAEDEMIRSDEHFHTNDDVRQEDSKEINVITDFVSKTCCCKDKCSSLFTMDDFIVFRADYLELTMGQKDVYVLGLLRSSIDISNDKENFTPTMKGRKICMKTFLVLNGIGKHRFYNLLSYYKSSNTLTPRIHGNCGRLPKKACKFEDILHARQLSKLKKL